MANTLYASFSDVELAERAAGALLDHGARAEDISFIVNRPADAGYTAHAATLAEREAGAPSATYARREAEYWEEPETVVPTPSGEATALGSEFRGEYVSTGRADTGPESYRDDRDSKPTVDDMEDSAKAGITTTTPADAAAGAIKGAGFGLGAGVLAAIASIFLPGIGIVAGGGALATAIAGAAGATAAGAVAGGVHGYLKDQGVPEQVAAQFDATHRAGGAVMALEFPSGDVDEIKARDLLTKYGASNIGAYPSPGWSSYETAA